MATASYIVQAIQDFQPYQDTSIMWVTQGLSRQRKEQTHNLLVLLTGTRANWGKLGRTVFTGSHRYTHFLPFAPSSPLLPLSCSFPKQGNWVQRTGIPLWADSEINKGEPLVVGWQSSFLSPCSRGMWSLAWKDEGKTKPYLKKNKLHFIICSVGGGTQSLFHAWQVFFYYWATPPEIHLFLLEWG